MYNFRKRLFIAVAIISLASCGTDHNSDNTITDSDTTKLDSTASLNARNFFYSLPSPLAMAAVFKRSGLGYSDGLCNNSENVKKYSDKKTQALNLGVYCTDLAYNLVNSQTQNALKYLESIKKLSDQLEFASVFDANNYIERFKENISKNDSLAMIFSELKREVDIFTYDNGRQNVALLIFTGAWIESMYIATQSVKNKANKPVATTIADQKYVLFNLLDLLSSYEKDPGFKDVFLDLSLIKSSFEKLSAQAEDDQTKFELNLPAIKEITEKISTYRNKIISK